MAVAAAFRSAGMIIATLCLGCSCAVAATITVNSTADTTANDGVCTLREAIIAANTNTASGAAPGECIAGTVGLDTIAFGIPLAGVHTFTPASTYPSITEAVFIDGYTQSGATVNTLAVGNNANLVIEINASGIPANADVFQIIGGGGSTIRGLVINRTNGFAIDVGFSVDSAGNTIIGNFIGTDTTGNTGLPSAFSAVQVRGSNNVIGTPAPADRNVLVGGGVVNGGTVYVQGGFSNIIQNNYIGINAAGTTALQPSNATGALELIVTTSNIIGGTSSAMRNIIIGTNFGIRLGGGPANNNLIQGNYIGTNATGTASAGIATGIGIVTDNGASNNTIGGSLAGAGNVISGGSEGIHLADGAANYVIQGNKIGTDVTGTLPIPNSSLGVFGGTAPAGTVIGGTGAGQGNVIAFNGSHGVLIGLPGYGIFGNSILSNGGLGISLGIGGTPVANDPGDADVGGNNLQNYPVLTSVAITAGNATISGTLNSTASTQFRLEFFANVACDPSGNGEGQTFIGFTNVTTDAGGNASFGPLNFAVPNGQSVITSTATDPGNNTSEFSACLAAAVPLPTLSINNVTANEGNSGTTAFTFNVTLSAASASTVTVNFATADATATAGSDYAATSGTVTFNPGVTTQSITVNVNGDTTVEPNETFVVNLSAPTNATIAGAQGIGTITNDDVALVPTLSIANASLAEGNSGVTAFTFSVTLSSASASTVTVNFATTDGTATAGSDYVAASGTLTFNPGVTTQTITVNVNGDTTAEGNETFLVNLSAPVNATIAAGQGTGTIVNDDVAPPPPAVAVNIPTLSQWALTALALLLLATAALALRRRAH